MAVRPSFLALALLITPLAVQAQDAAPTTPSPGAVTLRYKFAPGQVWRYKVAVNLITNNLTGPTKESRIPIISHIGAIMTKTVKEIRDSDGATTIEIKAENISVKTSSTNTRLWKGMQAILGDPRTILMTPTGNILSDQFEHPPANSTTGVNFSKEIISGNLSLPENPVQIGQNWNASLVSGMVGMQMAINSTLTDVGVDNGTKKTAKIAEKITGSIEREITKNIPFPMKDTGQITGDGTEYFDTDDGTTLSQDMTIQTNSIFSFNIGKTSTLSGTPHTLKIQSQMHLTSTLLAPMPTSAVVSK